MLRRAFSAPALLALTTLLTTTILVSTGAQAATLKAPSGLQPSGQVASATPTFKWTKVAGATSYEFQLDDSEDFSSTLHTAVTTNNTYVPPIRLKAGTTHWRVRATGLSNVRSTWSRADVVVDETAAPNPTSPIDAQPLPQPGSPALLRWSPVPGAVSYQIEVDSDGDWIGATPYSTPATSFQVPAPQAPDVWHWRVRADLGNGTNTRWSGPAQGATYEILPLADVQPDPSMDLGGTVQDVVLKWLPVPGATKYELQIGLDRDFNQPVETRTVVSTRYSPTTTYDNDEFFWRVRAIDAGGNKMAWPPQGQEPFSFHRDWPHHPELVWPPNRLSPAAGDDFYYQWTPVRHATRYVLEVASTPGFEAANTSKCTTASTTFTPTAGLCMPVQGQATYWRVRAFDAPRTPPVEGIYSDIQRFVYDSGRVELLEPENGASVTVPTLRWQAATDALTYKVEVRDNADVVVASATTNSLSWTPTGTASLNAARGPFTWTVQAVDSGGSTSPKYTGWTFSISGTPEDTATEALTPSPTAPTTRFPALEWEPLAGATYYRVRVGTAGTDYWDESGSAILSTSYPYPSATDTTDGYFDPGTYKWQVRAFTVPQGGGTTVVSNWGPVGTFEVMELPAVSGQRIALDGRALDANTACDAALGTTPDEDQICTGVPATPVLDWDSVPGAAYYMVYVANDRELTNRVFTGVTTTNSRWTPSTAAGREALADNQSGESYYWYIRPCRTATSCGPDPIGVDRAATNAFQKLSPRVELLDPASNQVNDCRTKPAGLECADDIAFSWEDYFDTNQERTFAGGEHRSPQTATRYRIEISTSESFASLFHYQEVDQPTYTLYNETLPEGDLWWRVQAIDSSNNRLTWSDIAKVRKASGGVELTSPTDGDPVAGTTPFSWQPHQHAASYRLEVARNGDTTYSPSNLVLAAADTKLASYVATKYLPASSEPYVWRVRWIDASGKQGPWSANETFRVVPGAVQLTDPGSGVYVPRNGPVFSWQPVGSAVKYLISMRPDGASAPSLSVTTPATSYATTSTLADGTYEWRVVAYDATNQDPTRALASSAWRTFKVDTGPPTVTKKTPATSAARTADFTATFSEPVTGLASSTMRLYVSGRSAPLSAKVTLSSSERVATLNPNANLVKGKTYTLKLLKGIKDDAGNVMAATSWKVKAK